MADALLDVRNLRVEFPSREKRAASSPQSPLGKIVAVRDLSFTIAPREVVSRVQQMLYVAEYKRRQAPPGVKVSRRSFGRDRRYPITNRFRERDADPARQKTLK